MLDKLNEAAFKQGFRGSEELNSRVNLHLTGNVDLLKGEVFFDTSGYSTSVVEEVKKRFEAVGWRVRIDNDNKLWFKIQ